MKGFTFILIKDILTLRDYQQTLNNGWVTIGDITPDSFNRRVAEYESALDKLEKKWSCKGQESNSCDLIHKNHYFNKVSIQIFMSTIPTKDVIFKSFFTKRRNSKT